MEEQSLQNKEEVKKVFCRRCGRELKNKKAKEVGFGPSCFRKYIQEMNLSNRKRLFEVKIKEN